VYATILWEKYKNGYMLTSLICIKMDTC
jgi:hypothetical protein